MINSPLIGSQSFLLVCVYFIVRLPGAVCSIRKHQYTPLRFNDTNITINNNKMQIIG